MKGLGKHIAASIAIAAVFAVCVIAIAIGAAPATLPVENAAGTDSVVEAYLPQLPAAVEATPSVAAPVAEASQAVEPEELAVAPVQPAPEALPVDVEDPQLAAPKPPAPAPNPPKNLVGTFIPDNAPYVRLTWDPNNSTKIDHFNIYRLVIGEAQGNVPPIGQSKKAEYEDRAIKPGLTYRYWVTAVAKGGEESGASNTADVKTYDNTKPAAPQGVTAVAIDPGVSFDWLPDTSGNLAGYNVYKPKGDSHNWRKLNSTPILDNHYYYASGVAGKTYAVSAVNFYGVESDYVKVKAVASAPVIYEENDPAITVEGLWATECYVGPANGKIRVAGDAGARLHLKFKGSQVKMTAAMYWTCGNANIYIDGALVKTVNLYSYSTVFGVIDLNVPGLKCGEHVLTLEAVGSGNPEGSGNFVNVDAFEVR